MYRHNAESIKESSRKRFLSKAEKDKFNNYPKMFIEKQNVHAKSEIDDTVLELSTVTETQEKSFITINDTSSGFINDVEIFGNTVQREELIEITPVIEGGLINGLGQNMEDSRYNRTDFIPVEYLDSVLYTNDNEVRGAHVYVYDENKALVKYYGIMESSFIITEMDAKFFRCHHYTDRTDKIVANITRTHLNDIKSVGELQEDGNYKITLNSTTANIINSIGWEQGSIDGDNGQLTDAYHINFINRLRSKKYIPISDNNTHITYSTISDRKFKAAIRFFDETKKYIPVDYLKGFIPNLTETIIEIPKGAKYIKFIIAAVNAGGSDVNETKLTVDMLPVDHGCQIEYGKQKTDYTVSQRSTCEIILPCQLEKIGKYSDRLFKRADGVWCIEKNIDTYILNGTENIGYNGLHFNEGGLATDTTDRYLISFNKSYNTYPSLCDKLPARHTTTIVETYTIIYIHNTDNNIHIKHFKTDERWTDIPSLKAWLSENRPRFKYVSNTPKIIELSKDVQILLNSFENKTYVFDFGLVKPNIKITLPKSLASSAESMVRHTKELNNRIDRITEVYDNSKEKYSTDKNNLIIHDNNKGIIDDVYVEGNTCTNAFTVDTSRYIDIKGNRRFDDSLIRLNSEYTVSFRIVRNNLSPNSQFVLELHHSNYTSKVYVKPGFKGRVVAKLKTLDTRNLVLWIKDGTPDDYVSISELVIVEGDYTDKPIDYFEKMCSVGEKVHHNYIPGVEPVLTIQSMKGNANLIDFKKYKYISGTMINILSENSFELSSVTTDHPYLYGGFNVNHLDPNTEYRVFVNNNDGDTQSTFRLYDFGTEKTVFPNSQCGKEYIFRTPPIIKDLTFLCYVTTDKLLTENKKVKFSDIYISKVESQQPQEMEISSKYIKYVDNGESLPVVLRSVEGVKDTIEKHSDGKYYYHKRCEEIILNGTENWEPHGGVTVAGRTSVVLPFKNKKTPFIGKIKCDNLLAVERDSLNIYGNAISYHVNKLTDVNVYNAWIGLSIFNNNLSSGSFSTDVTGVKNWLKANNTSIVIPLPEEVIYPCVNLDLIRFNESTHLSLHSGPIPSNFISVSNISSLGNTINNLKNRVSGLENIINSRTTFHSRLLLNNRYTSDRTNFKVDVQSNKGLSSDISIDVDLYDLIVYNILVGVSNYNRFKIEEMIDFYTILGHISYEIADKLFMLIEAQHVVYSSNSDSNM